MLRTTEWGVMEKMNVCACKKVQLFQNAAWPAFSTYICKSGFCR